MSAQRVFRFAFESPVIMRLCTFPHGYVQKSGLQDSFKTSVQWNLANPKSLGPEGIQISEMF